MIQRAIRTRSSSRRSTLSSSRSSPDAPGAGAVPAERRLAGPIALGRGEQALLDRRAQHLGQVLETQHGGLLHELPGVPGGQPQPAGHLLEAHLAAVLVGASGGERPARHARGSRGLDPALGAGAAAGPRVRPRAPLGLAVRIEHRALGADRALGDEAVVAAELRHARTSESSGLTPCLRCGPRSSPTFTSAPSAGPTSRARARSARHSSTRSGDADRLVLLGDVIELRERPLAESLEVARPVFEELGRALAGRPVVLVPGNHDHAFAEPWLARPAARCAGAGHRDRVAGRPGRRRRWAGSQAGCRTWS